MDIKEDKIGDLVIGETVTGSKEDFATKQEEYGEKLVWEGMGAYSEDAHKRVMGNTREACKDSHYVKIYESRGTCSCESLVFIKDDHLYPKGKWHRLPLYGGDDISHINI